MNNDIPTPRVEAKLRTSLSFDDLADFARQLERELAVVNELVESLTLEIRDTADRANKAQAALMNAEWKLAQHEPLTLPRTDMKTKQPLPFWQRLIVFAFWPFLAPVLIFGFALLIIGIWPLCLTRKLTIER